MERLPQKPGVYYFKDKQEKIVYVGMAKNLSKRVRSHFTNNNKSKQKQEFLRTIHHISYTICVSEFQSALLESFEIKRLWPIFNKSQKHYEHQFGVYYFEDAKGFHRLCIDKKKKLMQPLLSFRSKGEAETALWKIVKKYEVHPTMFFLRGLDEIGGEQLPDLENHNLKVMEAVENIKSEKKTHLIHLGERDYALVLKGKFYGMGTVLETSVLQSEDALLNCLTPYQENEVAKSLLDKYVGQFPHRVIELG